MRQSFGRHLRLPHPARQWSTRHSLPWMGVSAAASRTALSTQFNSTLGARSMTINPDEGPLEEVPQSWKGIKRFYDYASVGALAEDGTQIEDPSQCPDKVASWQVLIQDRVLRTKALNELMVPNKEVALAVCGEYLMQGEYIIPATTPIYNLVCFAIDQYHMDDEASQAASEVVQEVMRKKGLTIDSQVDAPEASSEGSELNTGPDQSGNMREDPNRPEIRYGLRSMGAISGAFGSNSSQRPLGLESLNKRENITDREVLGTGETQRLRELLKDYLETDSACYRVALDGKDPEEALLRRRQEQYYQPLLDWFQSTFGVQLGTTEGFADVRHPTEAYEIIEDVVDAADPYLRAALSSAVGCVHSTVIAMAFIYGHISVDQAFEASRVEEEYQIEIYGFVEDGHDNSRAHTRLQLASIASLLRMLPQSRPRTALEPLQEKLDAGKSFTESELQSEMEARLNRVRQRRMFDRAKLIIEREEREKVQAALRNQGHTKDPSQMSDLEILTEELENVQRSMNRIAIDAGMKPPHSHLEDK
eukprot:gb/GECG01000926.1/.p1 GENE.gb/GECG01000926.1/~~gb/GECG01000926.1/.p1  ORF type:complete len:534 (+),score=75.00 gb/GECG01000926.1/:1-1602(+)